MSCIHYRQANPPKERNYFDGQYNRYVAHSYSPRVTTPESYRSGTYGDQVLKYSQLIDQPVNRQDELTRTISLFRNPFSFYV